MPLPSIAEKLVEDINNAQSDFSPYLAEIIDNKVFIPLYEGGGRGLGLGLLVTDARWNGTTYEGGHYESYGIAFKDGKRSIVHADHMCRTAKSAGYMGALLMAGNIIELMNSDEVSGSMFEVVSQVILAIDKAAVRVGITRSPLNDMFYELMRTQLVETLLTIEEQNYNDNGSMWFVLGGKLKNILNMNLSAEQLDYVYNLMRDGRLKPFLKKMEGNEWLFANDGINLFPRRYKELLQSIDDNARRNLRDLIVYDPAKDSVQEEYVDVELGSIKGMPVFDPEKDNINGYTNVKLGSIKGMPVFDPEKDYVKPEVKVGEPSKDENNERNTDAVFNPLVDGLIVDWTDEEYEEYLELMGLKPKEDKKIVCPFCGSEIGENARYCPNCGTKLN